MRYLKRVKNMWIYSTTYGKLLLIMFFPVWLLSAINSKWE